MARISGVEVPDQKRVEAGLVYIKGIGPSLSKQILEQAKVDLNTRVKDLTEQDIADINSTISKLKIPVEGELRRMVTQNIRRLQDIKSYRGLRHSMGLPTRGQSTRRNSRTRKGKRKTVGGIKKKLEKK